MAVLDASILKESRDRYLTYALSVVSGRALPDIRDGLKPVQRRILYAMFKNLHLKPTASHLKSAKIVGEVLGNYHPHGDSACYEAMVRMAQDFSLRYPLVDGQGNFGSLDGDSAAAYRYTEAKLTELALEVVGEIDEETVDFRDNFDGTRVEPLVFPSRVPNLLINGASGIAVGMATSIPPHNLKDTIKAILLLAEDPEVSNSKLVAQIKAPDFPTGCMILNTKKELDEMYQTGRGAIRMRGTWKTEDLDRGKKAIIIDSIPYTVNKAQLVEKIAGLIIDRKLPQLQDIRDESTDDIRIVLELSSGANADIAMAYLFKNTALESNFSVNLTVLVPTGKEGSLRPENLSLKACLEHFLKFRKEVVTKRLQFEKKNLLARIHILEGLVKIFDALDEAIKIVRKSEGRTDAATKLKARFKLSDIQSFAIVDLRIYQLSKTNIDEIKTELKEKEKRVKEIDKILASPKAILSIITTELEKISEKYGDKRKSIISKDEDVVEFDESHYIVNEDVYAIVTADGWIKRIRQNNELTSTRLRDGDKILRAHPLSTRDHVVFFTNLGTMYSLSVTDFPSSSGYGDPIQKILKFKDGENIVDSYGVKAPTKDDKQTEIPAIMADYPHLIKEGEKIALVTAKGMGFLATIDGIIGLKRSGKRVMNVRSGDKLVSVVFPNKELAMFTSNTSGISIPFSEVLAREGAAVGIQLMSVRSDDELVSAVSYPGKGKFIVHLDSDKSKEVEVSEVVKGKRALKGNKVITGKGNIVSVEYSK
jgi:DNA gyrase subunit A